MSLVPTPCRATPAMQHVAASLQPCSSLSFGPGSSHLLHSEDMAPSPPTAQTTGLAYGKASMQTVKAAINSLPIPWSSTLERCLLRSELRANQA
jgi:hypothetical protein